MPVYLDTLSCLNINHGEPIKLVNPKSKEINQRGKINVICGENGIGKSFLLRQALALLSNKQALFKSLAANNQTTGTVSNAFLRIKLTANESADFNILHAELFTLRSMVGKLDLRKPTFPKDRRHVHETFAMLMHGALLQIPKHSGRQARIDPNFEKFWQAFRDNAGFRKSVLREFEVGQTYYIETEFLKELQAYQRARLGIHRQNDELQLTLRSLEHEMIFDDWSDGLKSLACLEALLKSDRFSLVLLDEIENHLHPRLISIALEILQRYDAQSLVTTHHPHVIFSRLVDRVVYLERDPEQRPNRGSFYDRRAITLETDFEKIASIYGLFHEQDRQLLTQSALVRSEADATFYREVLGSFGYAVANAKKRTTADAQTQNIAAVLAQTTAKDALSVIDIGAGKGRTFWEMEKIPHVQKGAKDLSWDFWEPDERNRKAIASKVDAERNFKSYVFDSASEIPLATYDIACIVNVLHELSPANFVNVITLANKLVMTEGRIIISEIYPLLQSERLSLPQ